ncbi:MAG: hypothetical protein U0Q55_06610 [Vicinamibacterales bacterium]
MSTSNGRVPVSDVEAVAVALVIVAATIVLASYLLDLAGFPFLPLVLLLFALAAGARVAAFLLPGAIREPGVRLMAGGTGLVTLAWLLWLAAPTLLPLSTGPDLTHHLLLIRYIEQHWRLVHDPSVERFLGEMAQYTPGSHVLVAVAGAVSRSDGLRAMHAVQAATVALKVVFLLAVCIRLLPPRVPVSLAMLGPVLLLASPRYFLGGFMEYGFLAQVVAELFVVTMWWAIVAWAQQPSSALLAVFGVAGAATFLTWPVYSGPPYLAALLVIALTRQRSLSTRASDGVLAVLPVALIAGVYLVGRLGWLQLAGTGGSAPWPSVEAFGWPLVLLAAGGFVAALLVPAGRPVAVFALAVLAQAGAFYVLATRAGAPQPYMALKMMYLLLWPMAACAALLCGVIWRRVIRDADADRTITRVAAATVVAVVAVGVVRPLAAQPAKLHPLPPAVSLPLYRAGLWAGEHAAPGCFEYLVGDDETAYWLHLAVLGNPRMSDRTGDNSTYEPRDAIVRWLTPGGLPYAIVDLPALPSGVREELDIVQQFGTAAVARRRGASWCDTRP